MSKGTILQSRRIKKIEKKVNKIYELIEDQMPKKLREEPYDELLGDLNIEKKIREFLDLYIEYPSISKLKLKIDHDMIIIRGDEDKTQPYYFTINIYKYYLSITGNVFNNDSITGNVFNNDGVTFKSSIWDDYIDDLKVLYKKQNQKMFDEGFKKMLDISNLNRGKGLKDLNLD